MRFVNEKFMTEPMPFWEADIDMWRMVINTNVNGIFLMTHTIVPYMLKQGRGRIINVSINYETMKRKGFTPYGSSKAALESMSTIWAQELEGTGVTLNVLIPGGATLTGMIPDSFPESQKSKLINPAVMGPPAVYLASDEAKDLNGQRIVAIEWNGIINNMQSQANNEITMWNNIYITGTAQWDSTTNTFTKEMEDWDVAYQEAWSNGNVQWTEKTDSLVQRKEEWINEAVSVVNSGSSNYISDELMQDIDTSTFQLLNSDLPDDVASAVKNRALELETEMMPKNSTGYLAFFNNAVSQSRETDVKFVLDGISAFTGDSDVLAQFNNEMNIFKKNQLVLAAIKMRDEFIDTIKQSVFKINIGIDDSDSETQYHEFAAMISAQGWAPDGNDWVKKDVTVDSTLAGGDKKESFSFRGYYNYTNRLDYSKYTTSEILGKINGEENEFNLLMAMEMGDINNDYSNTMVGLTSHVGSESYSSSGAPAYFNNDMSRGELYRITWALAFYGYKQSVGEQKAKTPEWDKPIDDGINFSLYDVSKVGLAVAMNFVPGLGSIASAAIVAGFAMVHDLADNSAGMSSQGQLGISLLQDAIS